MAEFFDPVNWRFAPIVAIFLLCLILTVTLQLLAGAYVADFAGEDEAAHYVTGLMVRTFLLSRQWLEPMEFAWSYYTMYPKVAIGHWPPMFYVVQALWTILFTASRESVLALMAVSAAACAALSYRIFSKTVGSVTTVACVLLFLCTQPMQYLSSSVMAELLVFAWTLLAFAAFEKYLDSERVLDSFLFGLFAAAAILTKANGFALALVPPIAILLARKVGLVRRLSFWVPLATVGLICMPWYLLTIPAAEEGWQGSKNAKFLLGTVAQYNLEAVHHHLGLLTILLAAAGCYAIVIRPLLEGKAVAPVWAVAMATLIATLVFHSVIAPVRDVRHLLAAILVTIFLAARGLLFVIDTVPILSRHRVQAAWLGGSVAASAFFLGSFRLVRKPTFGASQVAAVLTVAPNANRCVLVSAPGASGEGAIVAETALLTHQSERRIIRASKLLASAAWDGRRYRTLARQPMDVLRFLSKAGVEVVVWQTPSPAMGGSTPHHLQMRDTFRLYPDRFKKIASAAGVNTFDVYEVVSPVEP